MITQKKTKPIALEKSTQTWKLQTTSGSCSSREGQDSSGSKNMACDWYNRLIQLMNVVLFSGVK